MYLRNVVNTKPPPINAKCYAMFGALRTFEMTPKCKLISELFQQLLSIAISIYTVKPFHGATYLNFLSSKEILTESIKISSNDMYT